MIAPVLPCCWLLLYNLQTAVDDGKFEKLTAYWLIAQEVLALLKKATSIDYVTNSSLMLRYQKQPVYQSLSGKQKQGAI